MTRRWWTAAGGILLTAGAVVFLTVQVLDVDKWAGLLLPVVALIGLAANVVTLVVRAGRPGRRRQWVTQSTFAGGLSPDRWIGRSVRSGSVTASGPGSVAVTGVNQASVRSWPDGLIWGVFPPQDLGSEVPSSPKILNVAAHPDAWTQTGRELPSLARDSRLRELAVTYGEPAVVQALRDTAGALAVVVRTGAQAAS